MKKYSAVRATLLASISYIGMTPAMAQSTAAPDETVVVIGQAQRNFSLNEVLSTPTRLDVPLIDLPFSVDRLEQDEIVARGRSGVVDAALGTTGLSGQVRAGAAGVYSWRGFTENAVATLYDGVRVQGSTVTTRNYDTFTFEAVEIARGPASGLYGEGALAGAINYVRKTASRDDLKIEGLATYGTWDSYRLGAGVNAPVGDQAAVRIDAVTSHQGSQVDGFETQTNQILASFLWQADADLKFVLKADWFQSDADDAYWGTPVVNGRVPFEWKNVNYNNATNNRYKDDVLWLTLDSEWTPSEAFKVSNKIYSYQADRDWVNIGRFLWNAGTSTVGRTFWEDLAYDHSLIGTRLDARYKASDFQIAGGVDISRTDFSSPRQYSAPFGLQQQVDPVNPAPVDFYAFGRPRVQARETDLSQWAAYAEARWELMPRVAVQASLRYDSIEADFVRFDQVPTRFYAASYQDWSGSVALVGKIDETANLYVQWGRSATPADSLLVIADPATAGFDLTKGEGFELGLKGSWLDGRLEATGAIYSLTQSDIPGNDPANPALTIQIGEIESTGAEASVIFRPIGTVSIEANAAIVDAQFTNFIEFGANRSGNRPPNVPETVANLFVDWRFAPGWSAGVSARHAGDIAANTSNTIVFDGYTTFDADVRWKIVPGVEVSLIGRNLGGEDYAPWATAAGGQNAMANIAPGRSVLFSLSVKQ